MPEPTIHIAALNVELFIPASNSLKTKRMVLRSIKDRLKNQFNVSVAEVDYLDKWQRARLGIVMISSDKTVVEGSFQAILDFMETVRDTEITQSNIEFL
ncbi:MAG: DUF503 domain-containing protein [Candidatus Omnitrophica bacterium]|nr:DUF503 domain-containing protein [Candidatus Omnitrophota bacterium]MDD5671242.1 DUF503 domain-containing protein [Candidatus Omnitrophota bacterium]